MSTNAVRIVLLVAIGMAATLIYNSQALALEHQTKLDEELAKSRSLSAELAALKESSSKREQESLKQQESSNVKLRTAEHDRDLLSTQVQDSLKQQYASTTKISAVEEERDALQKKVNDLQFQIQKTEQHHEEKEKQRQAELEKAQAAAKAAAATAPPKAAPIVAPKAQPVLKETASTMTKAKAAKSTAKKSTSKKTIKRKKNSTAAATTPQSPGRVCLNDDFKSTFDVAAFTLLIPRKEEYVLAARVLGASIDLHTNATDKVILELKAEPVSAADWVLLQKAGWTHKCTIAPIKPTHRPSPRFVDQFAKLHVWGMTMYKSAVYMDADTFAVGDLSPILHQLNLGDKKIGVTADFQVDYLGGKSNGVWVATFNMGVFCVHPQLEEYQRLMKMQQEGAITDYNVIMAEQGWLNVVYNNSWFDIGLPYNANTAAKGDPKYEASELKIIHYTTNKPWSAAPRDPADKHFLRLGQPWLQVRDMVLAAANNPSS